MMNYIVKTDPLPDGKIVQSVTLETRGYTQQAPVMQEVMRLVIDTGDEQIKQALNQLGWHHRDEIAALDIPNYEAPLAPGCTKFRRYEPVQQYHRITVADVQKMEEQIRQIANALHL